jgi:hypothetical protein
MLGVIFCAAVANGQAPVSHPAINQRMTRRWDFIFNLRREDIASSFICKGEREVKLARAAGYRQAGAEEALRLALQNWTIASITRREDSAEPSCLAKASTNSRRSGAGALFS